MDQADLVELCIQLTTKETLACVASTRNECVRHARDAVLCLRDAIPETAQNLRSLGWRIRKEYDAYLRAFGAEIEAAGTKAFRQFDKRIQVRVYQVRLVSYNEPTIGILFPAKPIQSFLASYAQRHPGPELYVGSHFYCSTSRTTGERDKFIVHTPHLPILDEMRNNAQGHWTSKQQS